MRSRPGAIGMISPGWPVARFTARLDEDAVGVASLLEDDFAGVSREFYHRGHREHRAHRGFPTSNVQCPGETLDVEAG